MIYLLVACTLCVANSYSTLYEDDYEAVCDIVTTAIEDSICNNEDLEDDLNWDASIQVSGFACTPFGGRPLDAVGCGEDCSCYDNNVCPGAPGTSGCGDCRTFAYTDGEIPLAASIVRLGFHDSAGFMDGCFDSSHKDNDGNLNTVQILEDLYQNVVLSTRNQLLSDVLSRPDFWAWSAFCAIEYTAARQEEPKVLPDFHITYGRPECSENQFEVCVLDFDKNTVCSYDSNFPLPTEGCDDVFRFFLDNYGFNIRESTCLLGAHVLGVMRSKNLGFSGPWVATNEVFDNEYFKLLLKPERGEIKEWEQFTQRTASGKELPFWANGCQEIGGPPGGCSFERMLNTDICLIKDIEDDRNCEGFLDSTTKCNVLEDGTELAEERFYASCYDDEIRSVHFVELFASSLSSFMDCFVPTFERMLNNVEHGVQLKEIKPRYLRNPVFEQEEQAKEAGTYSKKHNTKAPSLKPI